jgi:protein-tyrosine phosphatase
MRVNVFWIPGPWRGKLGIVPRPRGGDWLVDETNAWREAGIDVVVSLLEPDEEAKLILDGEAAAAAGSGIEFRPFPIPDRGVPASQDSVADLANGILDALEMGKNVVVHCRQGIGRSALIAGAVLVATGEHPKRALKTIAESRGLDVPETVDQRQWVREFASWLLSNPAAQRTAAADRLRRRLSG